MFYILLSFNEEAGACASDGSAWPIDSLRNNRLALASGINCQPATASLVLARRHSYDQAIEFVSDLDLAGQSAVRLNIGRKFDRCVFERVSTAYARLPSGIDIDVACAA